MHADTTILWGEFTSTRSVDAKRQLVVSYLDLVRYVMSRFGLQHQGKTHGLEYDDVLHFGVLGLLHAVDRFNPAQGVKFETYAVPRIRGAVLDEFRKIDWVPRSVRETSRRIGKAAHEVMQEQGREPLDAEIAGKLSLSVEEYRRLIRMGEALPRREAVDDDAQDSDVIFDEAAESEPTPLERLGDDESRQILREALENLPERDRTIIALYYYEGLRFAEIGKVLNVTESRVSQIHSDVLRRLKKALVELRV